MMCFAPGAYAYWPKTILSERLLEILATQLANSSASSTRSSPARSAIEMSDKSDLASPSLLDKTGTSRTPPDFLAWAIRLNHLAAPGLAATATVPPICNQYLVGAYSAAPARATKTSELIGNFLWASRNLKELTKPGSAI